MSEAGDPKRAFTGGTWIVPMRFNRYAEFCQYRREIRGSVEHVIVGIDVAKERHHAFFGTTTGQVLLKRLLFDNNAGGFSL